MLFVKLVFVEFFLTGKEDTCKGVYVYKQIWSFLNQYNFFSYFLNEKQIDLSMMYELLHPPGRNLLPRETLLDFTL